MISFPSLAYSAILWTVTPSPEPSLYPDYNGDVNLVTPGVVGFIATLFIAVATLLIIVDMNRRVRRVRYRDLAQETIRNEQAAADDIDSGPQNAAAVDEADTDTEAEAGTGTDAGTDVDGSATTRAD